MGLHLFQTSLSDRSKMLLATFGTGDARAAAEFVAGFDFHPTTIIKQLDLLRPIYRQTTNYGHFGRKELPWEQPAHAS